MPGFELFGEEERKSVNEVLEGGVLMRYGFDGMRKGHWKAKELETQLEKYLKVKHAQLTSSGTSALNVALAILGIGAGDEVIMPTFTFVASFEAILQAGAIPVLVDIDDTLTLDPKVIENAITSKTKAIMPVHMCGSMANLTALQAICKKHNLYLLEDACQAFGGTYQGQYLGTIGDAGCFSFDYVKTITCGEGGAVVMNNDSLARNADHYTDHGHDHIGNDRGAEAHPFLGYNYRISELNAAVGVAQLNRIETILSLQRNHKKIIKDALSTIPEITFRRIPDEQGDSAGFLSFFSPSQIVANKIEEALKKGGIDAFWNYYNNNWHYIRKWDHLKEAKSLSPLSNEVVKSLEKLKSQSFLQSDDYISRNISCLIKLSWSQDEVEERAEKMTKIIKSVL